jgi:hypothetical protein
MREPDSGYDEIKGGAVALPRFRRSKKISAEAEAAAVSNGRTRPSESLLKRKYADVSRTKRRRPAGMAAVMDRCGTTASGWGVNHLLLNTAGISPTAATPAASKGSVA